jgi:hypothetical protein
MDTETLTVFPKGEGFEIIVQHDQSGSAYGITLSKNAYEQLHQHFVIGELAVDECKCIRFTGGGKFYANDCKIHPNG